MVENGLLTPKRERIDQCRSLIAGEFGAIAADGFGRWAENLMKPAEVANGHVTVGKKRVFLAVPHHGPVEIEAMMAALLYATDTDKMEMVFSHRQSSLLAYSFNILWCECMNANMSDYFIMQHADIFPVGEWATQLVDECDAGGYDVMHAMAAIKDSRGVTSTALGTQEHFGPVRKITTYEREKLPDTFGLEEALDAVGRKATVARSPEGQWCLLPNTGAMCVKIGPWCQRFPGFTIRDRIIRIYEDDRKFAADDPAAPDEGFKCIGPQVAPEDWNFGRWCASKGMKVGGTRKVKVAHFGRGMFTAASQWGDWLQDESFLGGKAI